MSFLRPTPEPVYGPRGINPVSMAGIALIGIGVLVQGVMWMLRPSAESQ